MAFLPDPRAIARANRNRLPGGLSRPTLQLVTRVRADVGDDAETIAARTGLAKATVEKALAYLDAEKK